jgi:hypothetical protein
MSKKPHGAKAKPDFVVFAEIYNGAQVGVFRNRDQYNQWFRDRKMKSAEDKGTNACARCVTDPSGIDWFIAYIPKTLPAVTVCHECLHLAWFILESYGVKVEAKNHEALAHLMQHLARQILSHK